MPALYACTNCGGVVTELGQYVTIERRDGALRFGEGNCPGCGGRDVKLVRVR